MGASDITKATRRVARLRTNYEQALADRDATLAQARDSGWRVADLSRLTGLSVQVIDAAIKRARS